MNDYLVLVHPKIMVGYCLGLKAQCLNHSMEDWFDQNYCFYMTFAFLKMQSGLQIEFIHSTFSILKLKSTQHLVSWNSKLVFPIIFLSYFSLSTWPGPNLNLEIELIFLTCTPLTCPLEFSTYDLSSSEPGTCRWQRSSRSKEALKVYRQMLAREPGQRSPSWARWCAGKLQLGGLWKVGGGPACRVFATWTMLAIF